MLTIIFWLVGLAAAIWVIYDVFTKNKNLSTVKKVIWTICAIFFSILTAIIYFLVYKMK
jgi:uncharacterized membrane protein YuzA (DUF378 family)